MYILLGALGIIFSIVMTAFIYKKIESGKLLTLSCAFYFAGFIIVSGLLIWIDRFSVSYSLIFTMLLMIAITIITFIRGNRIEKIYLSINKYIPLFCVLVIAGFLSSMYRSELYPTGQDEGLYQAKAMMYMGGFNDNELEFTEYEGLESGSDKSIYLNKLSEMEGVYLTYKTSENGEPRTTYEIHGIGTFAAMLAFWGDMFGMENMSGILIVMYLIAIAESWIICDNLKLKRYISFSVSALMTVCPIVLWCSKNVLVEIVLTMLFGTFLTVITDNLKKDVLGWSALPVVAICYLHVTTTLIIPLFMIIYLYMYIWMGKKKAMSAMIISLFGYVTGLKMMYTSASIYTSNNLGNLFGKLGNILNDNNFVLIMAIISVLFSIAIIALEMAGVTGNIRKKIKKIRGKNKYASIFRIAMGVIVVLMISFFVYQGFRTVAQGNAVVNMTIMSFLFMTGFICLPLALLSMVLNGNRIFKDHGKFIITLSLVYVLVIYAGIIWRDIYYYYYYTRYFAPFMVLVFVEAAILLDYFKAKYVLPVCAVVVGVLVWTNMLLYTAKDLTYGNFAVVTSIENCVDSQDAIVLMDDALNINKIFMLPVKAMTGADIYFLNYDYEKQINDLAGMYEDIYLLGFDTSFNEHASYGNWQAVYKGVLHNSTYDGMDRSGLPYPKSVIMFDSPVALYIYKGAFQ